MINVFKSALWGRGTRTWFQNDLYMQFSGVYIKAHISLSDFAVIIKTFLQTYHEGAVGH